MGWIMDELEGKKGDGRFEGLEYGLFSHADDLDASEGREREDGNYLIE